MLLLFYLKLALLEPLRAANTASSSETYLTNSLLRTVDRIIVEISHHCQQFLTVYNAKNEKNFKGVQKMSAYDLAERVKTRLNLSSDYQLSELLGISRSHVSNWKTGRNNPDGVTMLKLAELAGLSAHDALILVTKTPAQAEMTLSNGAEMLYIM